MRPGRNDDHVSLVDILPTLRDTAGLPVDPGLPGRSLLDPIDRPVLSEYHAQGMVDGGFMLKSGRYKYCWYGVEHAPPVFDVEADPLELHDLSGDQALVRSLDAALRLLLDPARVDILAKNPIRPRVRHSDERMIP